MIEVSGLTKRFGDVLAVDEVSFEVRRGELLALVGGSGSGKTTLLRMINRLIEATAGTIRIDGEYVTSVADYELRRRIGYVFQQVGLFPHMTVGQNIAVTLSLLGWSEQNASRRVEELVDLLELPRHVIARFPSELSGGQQQRVGVARALAARPSIMLLDEPFGALDPLTRCRLQESFSRIHAELSMTAVLVTHDMAEALLLGSRVAVLRHGRLVQLATPAELLAHPADEYVEKLIEAPRRQARVFHELSEGAAGA